MAVEIPLKAVAYTSSNVTLDDEQFILDIIWSDRGDAWSLSILTVDETPVVSGIKMTETKVLNFEYPLANAPKGLLISIYSGEGRPTFEDLGSSLRLYYYTEAERNVLIV